MRIWPQPSHCSTWPPRGCRAAGFDGAHDAALAVAQMTSMGIAVSGAVVAEDIRHLRCAAHGAQPGGITSSESRRAGSAYRR